MTSKMLLLVATIIISGSNLVRSQVLINELMPANVLTVPDEQGDYDDWLEVYNSGANSVNIGGYYFSDDATNLQKWQVPVNQPAKTTVSAHGYLIIWADQQTEQGVLHATFKLTSAGDKILFVGSDGTTILDSIRYPQQFPDVSFSRYPDGANQWGFSPLPTPGRANLQNYPGFAPAPEIMAVSGFFPSSVSVMIIPAFPSDSVYFTIEDGSEPPSASSRYLNPLNLTQTTVLRARTIRHGLAASEIVTKVFFIATNSSLPVLAIMTDPDNLFDSNQGIYANPNEEGRAWERKVVLDYFLDNALEFDYQAGLRIQGHTGRNMAKKSFRFFFRNGYGHDFLDYKFYWLSPVDRYKNLVLRAGFDDELTESGGTGTLLRDPLVNELWRRLSNPTSHGLFSSLYLNNDYWGIYEIREDLTSDWVRDYYHYSDIDIIRLRWPASDFPGGWELEHGDAIDWENFISLIDNNTFTSDSMFAKVANCLDIDQYTTLMALAQATQYRSWNYGAYVFKEKRLGAKWRWVIWDMDRSYTDLNWNEFTPAASNNFWINGIAPKLLKNPSYRHYYINRLSDLLNTTFLPENVLPILDSLAAVLEPEIPAETQRWGSSMTAWHNNVETVRNFVRQRPAIVRQQAQNYFHLSGQADLTVGIAGGSGSIKINSITIDQFPWTGAYFKNVPVTITAVPAPGYQFAGWSDLSLPGNASISLNLTGNKTISANFVHLGEANAELFAPKRIPSGQRLPVVVRLRDAYWNINFLDQTPMTVQFAGAHADTVIQIKRGAGTGVVEINSATNFTLSVQNANVPLVQKLIEISTVPTISYSGTLPTGDVIWDNTADRLITADVTVPAGCHLKIQPGTWILIKRYVNFTVQGQITVAGTAGEPVVITSDNWSEPWGGMEFTQAKASFQNCMVLNGGGDFSKGDPTGEDWHTGHQHIFFGKDNSEFNFDQCFFLNSPGKVFGAQDSRVTVTHSVTSFVWHGGEFHRVLLSYKNSHLMNLPNDDHIFTEDIDTDGLHIDYVNSAYPQYSIIDHCFFVTGKDDAIDHHAARLGISNCWLEDFIHEGVAASGGDTVKILNTIAMKNDQGFEAGWTEDNVSEGPYVFIDHCVAVENNVGLRIGDDHHYWTYRDFMKVTNSILYDNQDNIWNYLNSTHAPLAGALEISYSMTNDADYDNSPNCITGVPQFDEHYHLLPGSPGAGASVDGSDLGLIDSTTYFSSQIVINEIMYHEPNSWMTGDWFELFNPHSYPQDISGWSVQDDNGGDGFLIPAGTIMPEFGYLVICGDTAAFKKLNPTVTNYIGNLNFGLGRGDAVLLYSTQGELVDAVTYTATDPWPVLADGTGYSLSLVSPALDNSLPASWQASASYGGTPGAQNNEMSFVPILDPDGIIRTFELEQNYPNPFNPATRIKYALPTAAQVTVKIFDLLGREVETLVDGNQEPGVHQINWQPVGLASGIYLCQFKAGDFTAVRKLILQK